MCGPAAHTMTPDASIAAERSGWHQSAVVLAASRQPFRRMPMARRADQGITGLRARINADRHRCATATGNGLPLPNQLHVGTRP